MYIYATSKNDRPSIGIHLVYVGESLDKAKAAVDEKWKKHQKEEDHFPAQLLSYSALPKDTKREMICFYIWDGWWYSIERIETDES